MMLCASYSAIGLFQKKSRWGFRIWNFQGCQRNSTWNFQGLIKKEVEFPGVSNKEHIEFPGVN